MAVRTLAKKRSTNRDYVAFRYRVDALPGPVSKERLLATLIESAETGSGRLPNGWSVTWEWQNKKSGIWRSDDFETAIANSRAGFLLLMARRLRRDYRAVTGSEFVGPTIREASEEEIGEIEEQAEELEKARRERSHKARAAKRSTKPRRAKKKGRGRKSRRRRSSR